MHWAQPGPSTRCCKVTTTCDDGCSQLNRGRPADTKPSHCYIGKCACRTCSSWCQRWRLYVCRVTTKPCITFVKPTSSCWSPALLISRFTVSATTRRSKFAVAPGSNPARLTPAAALAPAVQAKACDGRPLYRYIMPW